MRPLLLKSRDVALYWYHCSRMWRGYALLLCALLCAGAVDWGLCVLTLGLSAPTSSVMHGMLICLFALENWMQQEEMERLKQEPGDELERHRATIQTLEARNRTLTDDLIDLEKRLRALQASH